MDPSSFNSFTEFPSLPGCINWDVFVPPRENRGYSTILVFYICFPCQVWQKSWGQARLFFFFYFSAIDTQCERNQGEGLHQDMWGRVVHVQKIPCSARSPVTGLLITYQALTDAGALKKQEWVGWGRGGWAKPLTSTPAFSQSILKSQRHKRASQNLKVKCRALCAIPVYSLPWNSSREGKQVKKSWVSRSS